MAFAALEFMLIWFNPMPPSQLIIPIQCQELPYS